MTNQEHRLTKKGKETRARIVAAAAKLMFDRGVAGTTVEDVKKEANASASQLYHYFKAKPDLVLAVIIYQTECVMSAQEPLLSHLDSMEALRNWRDAIVQLQIERQYKGGCPIGSLSSELADTDSAARTQLEAGFMQWELAFRKGLRAMYERGELRPDANPDNLALALLTALEGGLPLTQCRKETSPLEAVLDATIGVLEAEHPITYVTAWDAAEFLNFIGTKSDFVGPINAANIGYLSIQELCYEIGEISRQGT